MTRQQIRALINLANKEILGAAGVRQALLERASSKDQSKPLRVIMADNE